MSSYLERESLVIQPHNLFDGDTVVVVGPRLLCRLDSKGEHLGAGDAAAVAFDRNGPRRAAT